MDQRFLSAPNLQGEPDRDDPRPRGRLRRWRRRDKELEELERSFTATVSVPSGEAGAPEAGDAERFMVGEGALEALIVALHAAPRTAAEADQQLELAMAAARWLGSMVSTGRVPKRGTAASILANYASRDLAAVREIVTALRSSARPVPPTVAPAPVIPPSTETALR